MTTNRDAAAVLAETIGENISTYGPRVFEIADEQVARLEREGYVIVRRFDLSQLVTFVLQFTRGFDLNARRARTLLGTLRLYLPPSEDDDG